MDLQRSEALGDTQLQLRGHFRVFRVLTVLYMEWLGASTHHTRWNMQSKLVAALS